MGVVAIVPAAGSGTRMQQAVPKTFLALNGRPLLAYTLQAMQDCQAVDSVIVVTGAEYIEKCRREVVEPYGLSKVTQIVAGGKERQDSVYNGLMAAPPDTEMVAVHDGARALITPDIIAQSISEARQWQAVVVAVPVKDTLKEVSGEGVVLKTLERNRLWAAQTPQTFSYALLKSALEQARRDNFLGTDEAALVERLGQPVKIMHGSNLNLKITVPEDMLLAEAILASQCNFPL